MNPHLARKNTQTIFMAMMTPILDATPQRQLAHLPITRTLAALDRLPVRSLPQIMPKYRSPRHLHQCSNQGQRLEWMLMAVHPGSLPQFVAHKTRVVLTAGVPIPQPAGTGTTDAKIDDTTHASDAHASKSPLDLRTTACRLLTGEVGTPTHIIVTTVDVRTAAVIDTVAVRAGQTLADDRGVVAIDSVRVRLVGRKRGRRGGRGRSRRGLRVGWMGGGILLMGVLGGDVNQAMGDDR